MNRIKLSRNEKTVLRLVATGQNHSDRFSDEVFAGFVQWLEDYGLVKGAYVEGGGVESATLTLHGKAYIAEHPGIMDNRPFWKKILFLP